MKDFFEFLQNMGALHDAIVEWLIWKPAEQTVEFRFEDMYSNFEGLLDYPGKRPGVIVLRGVSDIRIDLEANEPLRVFEFLPQEGAFDAVLVTFSPSGKIWARFRSVDYPSFQLKESR